MVIPQLLGWGIVAIGICAQCMVILSFLLPQNDNFLIPQEQPSVLGVIALAILAATPIVFHGLMIVGYYTDK